MRKAYVARRRKQLKEGLNNPFNNVINDKMAERMIAAANKVHKPSTKEAVTGHDKAPLLDGEMPMGKIFDQKDNVQLLRRELVGRWKLCDISEKGRALTEAENEALVECAGTKKIKALKSAIWEDEMKRWLAEDAERRQQDHPKTYLKPLFTERNEYYYDLVKRV
jgi:hypothetical protein